MKTRLLGLALTLAVTVASAQMRPPPFMGGIPGMAQMRAIDMQRHQARTLLYREALEELRKNPKAADVPDCAPGSAGLCLKQAQEQAAPVAPVVKRRVALLFGNTAYKMPIPPLETPAADVAKIAEVLRSRFGYEVQVINNAGKGDIVSAVNRIAADVHADDSVLLFYAGHGYLMEDTDMGFWIPVDASVKTAANWISNTDISKLLKAIPAKQLILVSDSCFSGSLTKEQKVSADGVKREDVLRRRSVVVLSSGGEEPVSDEGRNGHSVFAWNLIKTLEATGGITPGTEVWRSVHGGVTKEFPQQPQYGAVVSAGHMAGGEYLFEAP
jgi:uncharacterized caspase-like protein